MIKDGGPAYPSHANDTVLPDGGMTLRDYFAAAALMGPIAELTGTADFHASIAYEYADAMIAERDKP